MTRLQKDGIGVIHTYGCLIYLRESELVLSTIVKAKDEQQAERQAIAMTTSRGIGEHEIKSVQTHQTSSVFGQITKESPRHWRIAKSKVNAVDLKRIPERAEI